MTPQVVATTLPGVGVKYEFSTRSATPLSLVVDRDGGSELVAYDTQDLDRAALTVALDDDESAALAGRLNGASMVHRVGQAAELPGVSTQRVRIDSRSPFHGASVGQTCARSKTGVSIVAIVRGVDVITSPSASEKVTGGDVLIVVGPGEGIDKLRGILSQGPDSVLPGDTATD